MTSVFTYGSLVVPEVWTLVAGRPNDSEGARLAGYRRRLLFAAPYPGIAERSGEEVDGVLWHGVDPEQLARLDAFEGEIYDRRVLEVTTAADRSRSAATYVLGQAHHHLLSAEPWDEARFRAGELDRYLEGCARFAREWEASCA